MTAHDTTLYPVSRLAGHPIFRQLKALGLSSDDSVEVFLPAIRDADDVQVYRCTKSGVLFLSRLFDPKDFYEDAQIEDGHDSEFNAVVVTSDDKHENVRTPKPDDDLRRAREFGSIIRGRTWLDFGAGLGDTLDVMGNESTTCAAVELNATMRAGMTAKGLTVYPAIDALVDRTFDVITLFHVLEHLVDPIETLTRLKKHLAPGGLLLMEVRHARDFLLHDVDCPAFREFSIGRQHLLLHTRESIHRFAEAAGYGTIKIEGRQRYPLSNHLYWLSEGRPGGHKAWSHLNDDILDKAYEARLAALDATDTLIAWVRA
jgi:SAM-dependent methyltransferase